MLVSPFLGVFSVGCSLCSLLCLGVCVHGPLCCSLCFAGLFLGFFGSFLPLFVFVGTFAWFGAFASALWCDSIVSSPRVVPSTSVLGSGVSIWFSIYFCRLCSLFLPCWGCSPCLCLCSGGLWPSPYLF